MLEASAENILQQDFLKAIKQGVKETQEIVRQLTAFQKKCGKPKREYVASSSLNSDLLSAARALSETKLREIFTNYTHDKISRDNAITEVRLDIVEKIKESYPEMEQFLIQEAFGAVVKDVFREIVLTTEKRCDGRELDQVRDISCQVDLYKPLHGSALFQRGQTQVMCTVSFDSLDSVLKSDPISIITGGIKAKNFMLHYEFPPYATNETGRSGPIGRREMGHGALAEKALTPLIPAEYPFTIRLTSEVLESNGSSSMATVCGGSLALMDAGVPIAESAAGIAMGLISKANPEKPYELTDYRIMTDILGIEDYFGDMDFKIAGTKKGITALQVDVKIAGLPLKIIMEAVKQAKDGLSTILRIMNETISKPREHKENWPVAEKLEVAPHKRGKLLGFGGCNLKKITAETGVHLTQIDDSSYSIFAPNKMAMDEAKDMIEEFLAEEKEPELEFGGIYIGKIVEVRDTGVMVVLYPSMIPTLLHNSQLDQRKISHPSALGLEVDQEISVKYFGRDPVSGRIRLSRKVLQATASEVAKSFMEKQQV